MIRSWFVVPLLLLPLGCGMGPSGESDSNHGELLEQPKAKFPWGPAAPEPPLIASPVPPMPEQTGSPMNPGDGPKAEDKLVPSTTAGATPK